MSDSFTAEKSIISSYTELLHKNNGEEVGGRVMWHKYLMLHQPLPKVSSLSNNEPLIIRHGVKFLSKFQEKAMNRATIL